MSRRPRTIRTSRTEISKYATAISESDAMLSHNSCGFQREEEPCGDQTDRNITTTSAA
jgi:hypothetical protein